MMRGSGPLRAMIVLAVSLLAAGCGGGRASALLVVTIDTLRADRLGCYGNASGLTPNIDRLAAESTLFEHATAAAPITLPSHASIFTGRYPDATGVLNNGTFALPASETTLAEALSAAGWRSGAVVGAFPLNSRFGLAQGFAIYDEDLPQARAGAPGALPVFYPERPASAVTDRAIETWRALGRGRRFLWVHYFDPHAPYSPPEPFATRYSGHPYDGEVAYTDQEVGRLVRSILADTPQAIIVLTSDHGEGLGEHGEKTHGVFLYEATLHVPLLVRAPRQLPAGRRVAVNASLVDVMPTVLGLVGTAVPPGVQGRDLRAVVEGSAPDDAPVFAESYLPHLQFRFSELFAIRRGALKYIDSPSPELFNLEHDPEESRNLHGSRPGEDALARELAGRISSADPQSATRAAAPVDPETEARLRSLGYASGGLQRSSGEGRGRDPKTMIDYLKRYDQAVAMISAGRNVEAADALRSLIPEAPENYMARYQLAAALLSAGRLTEAEGELRGVSAAAPEFANARLMLALVLSRLGKSEEAIASFGEAAKLAPHSLEPRLALAEFLGSVGRFDQAATVLLDAIRVQPLDAQAPRRLLELRAGRGDLAKAAGELSELADRFPRSAPLWSAVASARMRLADRDGARAAAARSLEIDPGQADALVTTGEIQLESGEFAKAEASFRRATSSAPRSLFAHFGLGRALLAMGRAADADREFARVLEINPRFSGVHVVQGERLEHEGRADAAADAYRRALAANPADRRAWEGLRRLGRTR